MSQQNLRSQQSFDTISNLSHVKKLLDPNAYRNYLSQQNSQRQFQKTSQSAFHKPGGFEDINFNVSPLDMPRQPVYGDLNFISRNFGNLCDRQFREQTKSSQKQKFGNRDKEQALKNLASQQDNLQKLKQTAKSNANANNFKQRPLKDPSLNDKRTFLKKVLDNNGMKIVVMFKSFEIEALKKGQSDVTQRKKKISTMIMFEDLQYLIQNFHPDEISDLFKKCTYVQNNQIFIDYSKFTSLPAKKPTGSILDKASSFPQQQDYLQDDISQNANNEGGYNGKYILRVQYPFIEYYVSELAHRQVYYTKKRDMIELFKTDYESLKESLSNFDSTKAKQVELQIKSNSRSFHSEEQIIQKVEIKKQESYKIERDQKQQQEQKKQIIQNLHLQVETNESKEDLKMKQFQETLNERLKTISEQQQRTQEDEEDVEESRQIIQQINSKNGFNNDYEEKQQIEQERADKQDYYLNESQHSNIQNDKMHRFDDITEEQENSQFTASKHIDEKQHFQENKSFDQNDSQNRQQSEQNAQQEEEEHQNYYQQNQQYEEDEYQNQENEDSQFNQNGAQQFQDQENSEQYQGQEEEDQYLRQAGEQDQFPEEGDNYQSQENQQYLNQEYEEDYQGQEEGQDQSQQEQYDQSQQDQQQIDLPQFSIEDTEREFDPQILQENIIAQSIVWNDVGYVIGFKSLEISIESNSFEGKIVKALSFHELYILLIETKELIVEEYIQEKIQISENLEIILDLPQLDFDFQECFALEEGHFYKFLDELNGFQINMEDQAYLIQFNKPSIEIQDEQGTESRQLEIDGQTLQNIVQRGFHFDFVVPQ